MLYFSKVKQHRHVYIVSAEHIKLKQSTLKDQQKYTASNRMKKIPNGSLKMQEDLGNLNLKQVQKNVDYTKQNHNNNTILNYYNMENRNAW